MLAERNWLKPIMLSVLAFVVFILSVDLRDLRWIFLALIPVVVVVGSLVVVGGCVCGCGGCGGGDGGGGGCGKGGCLSGSDGDTNRTLPRTL